MPRLTPFRRIRLGQWLAALAALLLALAGWRGAGAQASGVLVLSIEGPLTSVHDLYLERTLAQAERENDQLVILQLNTPGGQLDLMDKLIARIRASRVPVVVFVSPRGATAGSAGTLITLAGHAAAMGPETVIGAASPVGGQGEDLGETLSAKIREDMQAHVRALTANRPPEAVALAEAMIEHAEAVTADEAYAVGLVDYLAADLPDLLRQLDGVTLTTLDGTPHRLATTGAAYRSAGQSVIEQLLNILTNPNVVFLLLSLGPLLILNELSSPGGWVAGFLGAVCLLLAFYGLGVLPVNWFGLLFIALAFVLLYMEVHAPTHGALATAGIGSLIVGALVLFNSPGTPSFFRVSVPLVIGVAISFSAVALALLTFALRAQARPVTTGVEALVGQEAVVRTPDSVHVAGEVWSAEPAEDEAGALEPGQKVIVAAVKGLRLRVKRRS
ncbi:MAG: nodulation protein NfeD [Anaerolineales bacterium]|nr:nodulation protein NfeD [Anaerolineales bacterium]